MRKISHSLDSSGYISVKFWSKRLRNRAQFLGKRWERGAREKPARRQGHRDPRHGHRRGDRQNSQRAPWPQGLRAVRSQYCTAGRHDAQVRTLSLAADGGPLTHGRALFGDSARYPDIIQALLSPDGKNITMVVLTGRAVGTVNPVPPGLRVIQVPLAGGQPRLLYRGAVDGYPDVFLGADASGRYLLLAWARNGWIDHGRLHALAPQGAAITDAW
jgi:hypothetical protein